MVKVGSPSYEFWYCEKCNKKIISTSWEIITDSSALKMKDDEKMDKAGIKEGNYVGFRCPDKHVEVYKFLYSI